MLDRSFVLSSNRRTCGARAGGMGHGHKNINVIDIILRKGNTKRSQNKYLLIKYLLHICVSDRNEPCGTYEVHEVQCYRNAHARARARTESMSNNYRIHLFCFVIIDANISLTRTANNCCTERNVADARPHNSCTALICFVSCLLLFDLGTFDCNVFQFVLAPCDDRSAQKANSDFQY